MSVYFLDSDICIYSMRGDYPNIQKKIISLSPDKIKIPTIVKAELMLGAFHSHDPKRTRSVVEHFLSPFEITPFDDSCIETYSEIRFSLEKKGQPIGPHDLLIASIVITHQGALVTHNIKEFSRVHHLKLSDWTEED